MRIENRGRIPGGNTKVFKQILEVEDVRIGMPKMDVLQQLRAQRRHANFLTKGQSIKS